MLAVLLLAFGLDYIIFDETYMWTSYFALFILCLRFMLYVFFFMYHCILQVKKIRWQPKANVPVICSDFW